ncbi:MAG TPA: 6-pyruvoyl tetrahydropterin synthase family protein [Lacipirellulaceae bacterium]|nr:6-pyruvoyl tetrahydropterin synthase family protein [Lacipirellulaceae bacterium]
MSESFQVRIAKAEHVFSAAHFITFDGHCERLHGHNYHLSAEIDGPLDASYLVIDFLLVRAKLREIVSELDHFVLLPTSNPKIRVEDSGREVIATFGDRRWTFPSGDCRLLPVANTTAELLAAYIGKRLMDSLGAAVAAIERLQIAVDECDGQIGVWRWSATEQVTGASFVTIPKRPIVG